MTPTAHSLSADLLFSKRNSHFAFLLRSSFGTSLFIELFLQFLFSGFKGKTFVSKTIRVVSAKCLMSQTKSILSFSFLQDYWRTYADVEDSHRPKPWFKRLCSTGDCSMKEKTWFNSENTG